MKNLTFTKDFTSKEIELMDRYIESYNKFASKVYEIRNTYINPIPPGHYQAVLEDIIYIGFGNIESRINKLDSF